MLITLKYKIWLSNIAFTQVRFEQTILLTRTELCIIVWKITVWSILFTSYYMAYIYNELDICITISFVFDSFRLSASDDLEWNRQAQILLNPPFRLETRISLQKLGFFVNKVHNSCPRHCMCSCIPQRQRVVRQACLIKYAILVCCGQMFFYYFTHTAHARCHKLL